MKFWELFLPRHRACCDSANDAHVDLAVVQRQLDEAIHERDILRFQLDEQVALNDHLMVFLSVLRPDQL